MTPTIQITYFVHGTTTDNELGIASGHSDVGLSELGFRQSNELREKLKGKQFDLVVSSDLLRARQTAKIVFPNQTIEFDSRLKECDYGSLTGSKASQFDLNEYVEKPFPKGESYLNVEERVKSLLEELKEKSTTEQKLAFVSHQAPQLALEVLTKNKTWKEAVEQDWRQKTPKEWRPGWAYQY